MVDGNAEIVNCAHDRARGEVVEERGEGGAELVILSLSDPGGKKGEIRNRAMSGLGACWAVGGWENRDVGVGVGGCDNCDIHTHALSQRVADG